MVAFGFELLSLNKPVYIFHFRLACSPCTVHADFEIQNLKNSSHFVFLCFEVQKNLFCNFY